MLSDFLRQPVTRRWWRLFVLSTALPAIALGVLSLRAVRLVHVDIDQRAREEHERATNLVNALFDRALQSPRLAGAATAFRLGAENLIVLPRERLFHAGNFGQAPRQAERSIPEPVLDAVERARASGTPALYQRIAAEEPRLRDWTDFTLATLTGNASQTALPRWAESDALTPSGLPVALFAAESTASTPLAVRTLERLRAGSWWLSVDERVFHEAELLRILRMQGQDARLDVAVGAVAAIRRVLPRILAGERRLYVLGFLLLVDEGEEGPVGLAIPSGAVSQLFGAQLAAALGETAPFTRLRDVATGQVLWTGGVAAVTRRMALSAVPGWELAFSGAASDRSLREQQTLWYALIAGLLLTLTSGLYLTIGIVQREMELARRQAEFVAAVTHEFKSPITSMRLLLERMGRGRIQSVNVAQEYYEVLDSETLRLDRLVTRLLQSQRLESGRQHHREAADLDEVIQASVDRFERQAAAKSIRIDAQLEPLVVLIDRPALSEAVDNLIDNAIRYSGEATTVSVALRQAGSEAVIEVADQGIGIDADDTPHIFDRFFRGRGGNRSNASGTGLGLSIVKAAAEAHGGSVQVESAPDRGSKFTMRLPVEAPYEP